jgi:hypothetical protein
MADASNITAQIGSVAELGEEARALIKESQPPQEYLNLLMEKRHFPDAVRFLAHALPKREAVWWAWVCARRAAGAEPAPKIKASLDATEKWIAQPSDENRRAAMSAAETADVGTPAGCAGMAAFFSGGSMGPPDAPAVPPGPYLTAKAVAGAVNLVAVGGEPEEAPEKYRACVDQGLDVASRIKLW